MAAATKLYDSLVIGGGAAGLSVALGLGRVQRSCALFSHNKHRNHGIQHVHAVLGLDHLHPHEIYARGREQIKRYNNTDFFETEITKVEKDSSRYPIYTVSSEDGQSWSGRTVVIATGVKDLFPTDLEGYVENWPHNIYQCPFCDGFERKDLMKGILCWPKFDPMYLKLASMAHHMKPTNPSEEASKVTIFTNGPPPEKDEAVKAGLEMAATYRIEVETRPVVKLSEAKDREDQVGMYVHVRNPDDSIEKVYMGFVFHKPLTTPTTPELLKQLDISTTKTPIGEIATSTPPFNGTSSPGVFIAGDAGAPMTHVTTALQTGVTSAGGVAHYCNELDDTEALEKYKALNKGEAEKNVEDARGADEAKKIDDTGCIVGPEEGAAVTMSA